MPFDSSSRRGMSDIGYRYEDQPQGPLPAMDAPTDLIDNSRERFLEEAHRRGLPMHTLARPSLRLNELPAEQHPGDPVRARERISMSPPPLRIHKRGSSDPGRASVSSSYSQNYTSTRGRDYPPVTRHNSEARGITPSQRGLRGIVEHGEHHQGGSHSATEPMDEYPREYIPYRPGLEHPQSGTMGLTDDEDGSDDISFEEKRRRELSYTQKCLEGTIPGLTSENMFSAGPPSQYSEPIGLGRGRRSDDVRDPVKGRGGGSDAGVRWM